MHLRRLVQVMLRFTAATGSGLLTPRLAAATTGPFTLPFFDDAVRRTQPFGCTGFTSEPSFGSCQHYHMGVDYAVGSPGQAFTIASADAGHVVNVVKGLTANNCPGVGDPILDGNYVILQHGTVYTIYYHLAYNSVLVSKGMDISAGQPIATAGKTGSACGIHLHYIYSSQPSFSNQAAAMDPEGHWTTATGPADTGGAGRVPWLANYSTESNAGTEVLLQGGTRPHWVKFKNKGGRTWLVINDPYGRGRIVLYSTTGTGRTSQASVFQAPDWESSSLVTGETESAVAPDGLATSSFSLHAPSTLAIGNYDENFNLQAYGLFWLDYATLGSYHIPIEVDPTCNPGPC